MISNISAECLGDLVGVGVDDWAGIRASDFAFSFWIASDYDLLFGGVKFDVETISALPELRREGHSLKPQAGFASV